MRNLTSISIFRATKKLTQGVMIFVFACLIFSSVDAQPSISAIGDVTIDEGSSQDFIGLIDVTTTGTLSSVVITSVSNEDETLNSANTGKQVDPFPNNADGFISENVVLSNANNYQADITILAPFGAGGMDASGTGSYTVTVTATDEVGSVIETFNIIVNAVHQPISASGTTLIEAESFYNQGPKNLGTGEDGIGVEIDPLGFTNIGFTSNNDFVEYLIDVPQDGAYEIDIRLAKGTGATVYTFEINGLQVFENIPSTGGWTTYISQTATVFLPAGQQVLRFEWKGTGNYYFNIDDFTLQLLDNQSPVLDVIADQTNANSDVVSGLFALANDIENNGISYSDGGTLPTGLSINSATGEITGTIDAGASASSPYAVTITATDDGTPAEAGTTSFTWNVVTVINNPPTIDPVSDIEIAEGGTVTTSIQVNDDTNPSATIEIYDISNGSSNPSYGTAINSGDYTFTDNGSGSYTLNWITSSGDAKAYQAVVTANDGVNADVIEVFDIDIAAPIPGVVEANTFTNPLPFYGSSTPTPSSDYSVAIETTPVQNIGYIDNGDFVDYAINVPAAGVYGVTILAGKGNGGITTCTLSEDNGGFISIGSVPIVQTGWQTYASYSTFVEFTNAGIQMLRMSFNGGANIDNLTFTNVYDIAASAGSNGSISPVGNVQVIEGEDAIFDITPDPGFEIDVLTVDGSVVPNTAQYTFSNITANHTIDVTFKAIVGNTYTITATASSGGTITPAGSVIVLENSDQGFTITPDPGFEIDDVSVNGSSVGALTTYDFTNVTADATIDATFSFLPLYINVGGPQVVAGGKTFIADAYFTVGTAFTADGTIPSNTSEEAIYQKERYGDLVYNIPVPNGNYIVDLYMAEMYQGVVNPPSNGVPGKRIFDINIEGGALELDDFDMLDPTKGGALSPATAMIKTFQITVADGALTIEGSATVDQAKLNGIGVRIDDGSANMPPSITAVSSIAVTEGQTITQTISANDADGISEFQIKIAEGGTEVSNTLYTLTQNENTADLVWNTLPGDDGTYTATVLAFDGQDVNSSTFSITVAANQPPVITLIGDNPTFVELGGTYSEEGATAIDPEEGALSPVSIGGDFVNTAALGDYLVTYNISDGLGLAAVEVIRTVSVTNPADTEKPVITVLGDNPLSILVGSTFTDPGASATDNVDNDATLTESIVVGGDVVDVNTVGPYIITYNVTDAANNPADEKTRTVNVIPVPEPGCANAAGGYRVNAGGPSGFGENGIFEEDQTVTGAGGSAANGTPSPYYVSVGDNTFGSTATVTNLTGYPDEIFQTERWLDGDQKWEFPANGTYDINLLFNEGWTGEAASPRVFDVIVEGNIVLDDFRPSVAAGGVNIAIVETISGIVVTDGILNIDLIQGTQNPAIKGIDICFISGPANTAPVVSISSPANGTSAVQGSDVTFTGNVTDVENDDATLTDLLSWSSDLDGDLPSSGGTFDFAGLSVGTHIITATVTDFGGLTGTASINYEVTAGNTAPIITAIGNQIVQAGQSISVPVSISDADGDISTGVAITGPAFMTNTGVSSTANSYGSTLTFTPSSGDENTYTVTITANDGNNPDVTETFDVTVTAVPDLVFDITSPLILNAEAGQTATANFILSASDASSPTGINLTGSDSWVSGADPIDAGVSGTITMDAGAIGAGTYKSSITASLSGYNDAVLDVYFIVEPNAPTNPADAIGINVNGAAHTTSNGLVYISDADAVTNGWLSGGTTFGSGTPAIVGSSDDVLYQKERYGGKDGLNQINIDIPVQNGEWQVVLHFAELYHGVSGNSPNADAGLRIFDVSVEGNVFLDNFDMLDDAAGGISGSPLTAIVKSINQTITDGVINININADPANGGVDNGKISAVSLIPINLVNTAPTVSIDNPTSGTIVPRGAPFTVSGMATDAEEGTISSDINWTTSDAAATFDLTTGASVSLTLIEPGTTDIFADVMDSNGAAAPQQQISVNVPGPQIAFSSPSNGTVLNATSVDVVLSPTDVLDNNDFLEHYHFYINPTMPFVPGNEKRISTAGQIGQTMFAFNEDSGDDAVGGGGNGIVEGANRIIVVVADQTHAEFSNSEATASIDFTVTLGQPDANFTISQNPAICGTEVTFDGTSSTHTGTGLTIVSYEWDLDYDGITFDVDRTGSSFSETFTAFQGPTDVALRVTDDAAPTPNTSIEIISFSVENQAPVSVPSGPYVITIGDDLTLDGSGSSDPDACGDAIASYEWDLNGDDSFDDASGENPTLLATYLTTLGLSVDVYDVKLRVTDEQGASIVAQTTLTINDIPNSVPSFTVIPDITINEGEVLNLASLISISDADGDALAVTVTSISNEPQLLQTTNTGAQADPFPINAEGFYVLSNITDLPGSFTADFVLSPIFGDGGGANGDGNGLYTITVEVQDEDLNTVTKEFTVTVSDVDQVIASDAVTKIEAESFDNQGPANTVPGGTSDVKGIGVEINDPGVTNIGFTSEGDFAEYFIDVAEAGIYDITFQVAKASGSAATMNINQGAAMISVSPTGDWQIYEVVTAQLVLPAGPQVLRFDWAGSGFLFNIDYFEFTPVADLTPPVITLEGDNPQLLELGTTYTELGATATDNVDGDISGDIVIGATNVDVNTEGTYQVTYNVTDVAGNPATQVIREVMVSAPNTAPMVSITSPADNATAVVNTPLTFTGSATDAEDEDLAITDNIVWTSDLVVDPIGNGGTFTTSALLPGEHTITATVTDEGGLTAQASITITISNTNTPPAITIDSPLDGSDVNRGSAFTLIATATDTEDGVISNSISWSTDDSEASVIPSTGMGSSIQMLLVKPGATVVTASITDVDNNTVTASITLNVSAPEISLVQPLEGSTLNTRTVTFEVAPVDMIPDNEEHYHFYLNPVDIDNLDPATRISTASDPFETLFTFDENSGALALEGAGNGIIAGSNTVVIFAANQFHEQFQNVEASVTVNFDVIDNTPPVITLLGDNPIQLQLGDAYVDPGFTASDDFDGDITGIVVVDESALDINTEGTYDITYNVSDAAGNPAVEATRTVIVSALGGIPQVFFEITPGTGIGGSTYGSTDNFQITNQSTGTVRITKFTIDLSTAILPDMVFDPVGAGGDATAQCFTPDLTKATTVGLVSPSDPCVDPFLAPREGGFDIITMDFTDFNPAENFSFAVDIDPNSIQGVPGAGFAGAVSGLELAGATITVEFENGYTIVSNLYEDGSFGGSQVVGPTNLPAPTLQAAGTVTNPSTAYNASQEITICGEPNGYYSLLQIDARLHIESGEPPYNVSDPTFYANELVNKVVYNGQFDSEGKVTITVPLLLTPGTDGDPDGGLNYFMAVQSDQPYAVNTAVSATSDPILLLYDDDPVLSDLTGTVIVTNAFSQAFDATVALYQGSSLINTYQVSTNANGEFLIPGILPGTYDFWVKNSKTLAVLVNGSLSPGPNAIDFGAMVSGDFQNDNDIDIIDFSGYANAFGFALGDAEYNSQSDFNFDNVTSIVDFSMFANGYGMTGAPAPSGSGQLKTIENAFKKMSDAEFDLKISNASPAVDEVFEVIIDFEQLNSKSISSQFHLLYNRQLMEVVDITVDESIADMISDTVDSKNGVITFEISQDFSKDKLKDMLSVSFRREKSSPATVTLVSNGVFNTKSINTRTK